MIRRQLIAIVPATLALLITGQGAGTATAQTTIVQSNTGTGCSTVCINGNCTSTCGEDSTEPLTGNQDVISRELALDGFSEVVVGDINTTVVQGKTFSVSVIADSNLIDQVEVSHNDKVLIVQLADGYYQQATLEVEVVMPELDKLTQKGAATLQFKGFNQPRLSLAVQGTGNITGVDNLVTDLIVTSSGTSNLDLKQSELTNAEVTVMGTSNVQLNFADNEGILSGRIDGVSALHYCGNPQNHVDVSGIADIRKIHCS